MCIGLAVGDVATQISVSEDVYVEAGNEQVGAIAPHGNVGCRRKEKKKLLQLLTDSRNASLIEVSVAL